MAEQAKEVCLGGFMSANLKKGLLKGYGLYITNRRIIGVKKRALALPALLVGGLAAWAMEKVAEDERVKLVEELDKNKDFEIYKERVQAIELKKPSFFKRGHLRIISTSGEETKIMVLDKKAFNALREMMSAFKPEALTVIE